MRFSLLLSLAIALVLSSSASALELIRTLPASDVNQSFYGVRFLIFDGPEAIEPIQTADFAPGQYWLQEQGEAQVVIGAELDRDIDPQGLWIETELDGQTKGERVPLRVVTPGVTFAGGNNLDMSSNTITGLAMPAAPGDGTDAVRRAYVDANENQLLVGENVHNLLYWNGSAWALVPAPTGDSSMLSMCGGAPAWTQKGCLAIGDKGQAGGVVIYITDGGGHGLEVAPEDQGEAPWGCAGTLIDGANEIQAETGAQNTADILVGCAEAGIAARLADEYSVNGYSDWFLPSRDELDLLFDASSSLGGLLSPTYWSSSQFHIGEAWADIFEGPINVPDGTLIPKDKNEHLGVRAIRAF